MIGKPIELIQYLYNQDKDKKFEIKGDKFKVFIKRKEYSDKMYHCILYLENYDILFYICNYEELRKEIIRRIEIYLNESR